MTSPMRSNSQEQLSPDPASSSATTIEKTSGNSSSSRPGNSAFATRQAAFRPGSASTLAPSFAGESSTGNENGSAAGADNSQTVSSNGNGLLSSHSTTTATALIDWAWESLSPRATAIAGRWRCRFPSDSRRSRWLAQLMTSEKWVSDRLDELADELRRLSVD
jgi:hypothetical protein